jgi:hypothetical protein
MVSFERDVLRPAVNWLISWLIRWWCFFGVVWWLGGGGGELSEFQEGFLGGKKREKNNSKQTQANKNETKREKKVKNTFSGFKKSNGFLNK